MPLAIWPHRPGMGSRKHGVANEYIILQLPDVKTFMNGTIQQEVLVRTKRLLSFTLI
jgi:hypothetical protein